MLEYEFEKTCVIFGDILKKIYFYFYANHMTKSTSKYKVFMLVYLRTCSLL
jgi:hypothetical protein